ncbi:MAG: arginine--tRNA ligase [Candidatus Aenigmarchaeota archaeon]|nr:arginine--tRNA ligase [Candidatus Aenigmarchaeota archaeon]
MVSAELEKAVRNILKKEVDEKDIALETPPNEKMGDFAFPCFTLSKKMKKSPVNIAKELADKIRPSGMIDEVKPVGPYLNFFADWEKLGKNILESIKNDGNDYGKGEGGLTYLLEVFQANPFKSFHIGHVKNAVFGEAINRILLFNGFKTITVNFSGDVGTHVAKWLWYFKKFYKDEIPKEDFSKWAGEIYASACEKAEEKEEYKEEVAEINRLVDRKDSSIMDLWKNIRDLCYDDLKKIKDELGVSVEKWYPESETVAEGKKVVKELIEKGILEESDGAYIANLEKYNLGVLVFMRNDGTPLYAAKDAGLLHIKKKDHKVDKFLYVVASEHELYFKQLFKVYELAGFSKPDDNIHISYGLVTLKEGKMASRLGNVIVYEDLKNEMIKRAKEEIEKRNPDLENKDEIARIVAFGAMKFTMLNIDNVKPIKFDWDEALDMQGRTGPYIQYTHARICSLLRKAEAGGTIDASLLKDEKEISLLRHLSKFGQIVEDAGRELKPLIITNYVYELASKFNEFYQFVPVIKADEDVKKARIGLIEAVKQVLGNGMWILGIEGPEEM